jgi:[DsrC]-trisulfide reductase subunit M
MGTILIIAAYGVYVAFWIRFLLHALAWCKTGTGRYSPVGPPPSTIKTLALTLRDVVLLWRLLKVNPALWFGEWVFHVSFLAVLLRHLRYFLEPVPSWVWWVQVPGLIAGYILPLSLLYILAVRLLSEREKYSSPANLFLLGLVLAISSIGVMMHAFFKPDLAGVKLFVLGILAVNPASLPVSALFLAHFALVLILVVFLPTHILTAPLVMLEARKRDLTLPMVMHEEQTVLH